MISLATLSSVTLTAILAFALPCMSAAVTEQQSLRDSTRQFYARSHSLGHNYVFPARDGWVPLNVTDMQYKYSRSLGKPSDNGVADVDPALHAEDSYALAKRTSRKDKSGKAKKAKAQSQKKAKASKSTVSGARVLSAASTGGLGGVVGGALDNIKNALHGTGNPEPVIITWYILACLNTTPLHLTSQIIGTLVTTLKTRAAGHSPAGLPPYVCPVSYERYMTDCRVARPGRLLCRSSHPSRLEHQTSVLQVS